MAKFSPLPVSSAQVKTARDAAAKTQASAGGIPITKQCMVRLSVAVDHFMRSAISDYGTAKLIAGDTELGLLLHIHSSDQKRVADFERFRSKIEGGLDQRLSLNLLKEDATEQFWLLGWSLSLLPADIDKIATTLISVAIHDAEKGDIASTYENARCVAQHLAGIKAIMGTFPVQTSQVQTLYLRENDPLMTMTFRMANCPIK